MSAPARLNRRRLLCAAAGPLVPALAPPGVAAAAAPLPCDAREREYFGNRALTDQHGRQVRFYDDVLRDRTVLVGWIFTHCPDACPLLAARCLHIADAVAARNNGAGPRIVHLSTDPRRDTPARLRAWAARFGDYADWVLLTGAPADLRDVARRLGQTVDEARPDQHTTLLLGGNVAARRWARLRPDMPPEAAAAQLAEFAAVPPVVGGAACAG